MIKITSQLIEMYIEQANFALSTARSEAARLRAVARVLDGDPDRLWAHISSTQKPYSRTTTWTRAVAFVDWLISRGDVTAPNVYALWRKKNARLLKGTYVRKTPGMTFEDAIERVKSLPAGTSRRAQEILYSGMRWAESASREGNVVVGKGNKLREVFVPDVAGPALDRTYSTFYRHLKSVGLTPHMLRKLALSRVVEMGANEYELVEVAGWSSLSPALSYIRRDKEKIRRMMLKVAGG